MSTRTKAVTGWLSGFCNPTNPADSHGRCHGEYGGAPCACACHDVAQPPKIVETGYQITSPGLVHDMSDETYHGDPVPHGSLSSTFVRLLTEHVPAKAQAIRENRKPTKAMNLGKAAHRHALGAGPRLIVWEHDGRTKAGKAERAAMAGLLATEAAVAVTEDERDQAYGMVEALTSHSEVVDILAASSAEVSGFWTEGGIWCRARYDTLADHGAHDYKTTQDVTRRGFSKALGAYGYHQQADWYLRGLRALAHPAARVPFRFICQETEAPYLVQIHTPDEEAMLVAAELNDRAIRVYAEAMATGTWPGHPELVAEPVPLPAWYFHDHDHLLDTPTEVDLKL